MIIDVHNSIKIHVPNVLLLNYPTAFAIHKSLKKKGLKVKTRQIYSFMKSVKKYKKRAEPWSIVEIEADDGDTVTITI